MEPAGYCPRCDYPMNPGVCPECGAAVTSISLRSRPRGWLLRNYARIAIITILAGALLTYLGTRTFLVSRFPTRYLLYLQVGQGELAIAATNELLTRLQSGALSPDEAQRTLAPWYNPTLVPHMIISLQGLEPTKRIELGDVLTHRLGFMPVRTPIGQRSNLPIFVSQVDYLEIRVDDRQMLIQPECLGSNGPCVMLADNDDLEVRTLRGKDREIIVKARVTASTVGVPPTSAVWTASATQTLKGDVGRWDGVSILNPGVLIGTNGVNVQFNRGKEDLMFPHGEPFIPPILRVLPGGAIIRPGDFENRGRSDAAPNS